MTKNFPFFGSVSGQQLGPLEQQLLQEMWTRRSATVRELVEDGKITQAYTTVMTTLDRLYKKRFLDGSRRAGPSGTRLDKPRRTVPGSRGGRDPAVARIER